MAYNPITRTVSQVLTEVKRKFGDTSGVQVQDADIIGWINDAQRDIAEREEILKGRATFSSVVAQADYPSPITNVLEVYSLHYDGEVIPNVTFEQAEQEYISKAASNDQAAVPRIWYSFGGTITFYPAPTTVATVTMFYSALPGTVALATDLLTVPDRWYNAVVHYCLMQAYELDEDWQANQAKSQMYTEELQAQAEHSAAAATFQTITEVVPY